MYISYKKMSLLALNFSFTSLCLSMTPLVVEKTHQFKEPITAIHLYNGTLFISQIQENEQDEISIHIQKKFFDESLSDMHRKILLNPVKKNDGLELGILVARFIKPEHIQYHLKVKSLKSIRVSSSYLRFATDFKPESALYLRVTGEGSIETKGITCSDELTVESHNKGNVTIDSLDGNILKILSNKGTGTIKINGGEVNTLSINISDKGQVQCDQLQACNGTVKVLGKGKAIVNVSEQLTVEARINTSVINEGPAEITYEQVDRGYIHAAGNITTSVLAGANIAPGATVKIGNVSSSIFSYHSDSDSD